MIHLTQRDAQTAQSRFYHLEIIPSLWGQWGVQREWGRLGQSGTLRVNWYDSQEEAQYAAAKLAEAKISLWYRETGIRGSRNKRTGRQQRQGPNRLV